MGKFGAHLSSSESRQIFQVMDNDKDGKISFQEFLFEYERKSSKNEENKEKIAKNSEDLGKNSENLGKIEEKIAKNEEKLEKNSQNNSENNENNQEITEKPRETLENPPKEKEEEKKQENPENEPVPEEKVKKSSIKKQSIAQPKGERKTIVFEDPEEDSKMSFLEYKTIKKGPLGSESQSPEIRNKAAPGGLGVGDGEVKQEDNGLEHSLI